MHMSPATKTALIIGGAAAAAVVTFAVWPKKANATQLPAGGAPAVATEKSSLDDPSKWTPSSTLEPGSIYLLASLPPPGAPIDRLTLATQLQGMNWANGSVLYVPGEDLSNWPKAIPALSDQAIMKEMYVVVGTWGGPAGTVIPAGTNTMPLRYVG